MPTTVKQAKKTNFRASKIMQITLLGHASLLINGGGVHVLMDPVFFDPFENELTVSCPSRRVDPKKFPPIDAVLLSHGHADHFDKRSMAELNRETPVYLPRDPELASALGSLGFSKLRPMEPSIPFSIGTLNVLPTGSRDDDEVGAVFWDDTGSVWNQVDTATHHRMVADIFHHLNGRALDAVFCPFNPLLEYGELWLSETEFPQARYERLLEAAISSQAKTVIPASSGQRLSGRLEWLNARVFPVSRERFLRDLRDVAPERQGLLLNPGQALRLEHNEARIVETPYATTLTDDTHLIEFHPEKAPPPPLVDLNSNEYDPKEMEQLLDELFTKGLKERLNTLLDPSLTGPLRTLWDRRATLQLSITFPENERSWHIHSWHPELNITQGAHPEPDYTFQYVASELVGYIKGHFNIRGQGQMRAFRHPKGKRTHTSQEFRFSALDPGRLFGEDLYDVVDATFHWHPLIFF